MKKRSPQQTGSVFLCLKSDLDHIPTGTIFTDAILAKNEKQLIEQVKAQTEDVFHLYWIMSIPDIYLSASWTASSLQGALSRNKMWNISLLFLLY